MHRDTRLLAALAVAALIVLPWACKPFAPRYESSQQTAIIGVAGGELSLTDNGGFTITLTLPYGALAEDTTITLRSVGTAFDGPFRRVLYPGLEIEPRDLLFEYPARLEIQCPVGTDMHNSSVLYCCWSDTLMAPLGDLMVNPDGPQIWGSLYVLGRYALATPTLSEMQAQLTAWADDTAAVANRRQATLRRAAGDCPPDGYGWQGLTTRVGGMLGWYAGFEALDSPAGQQGMAAADAITADMVTNAIMEFSTLAPPMNPCDSYIRAALRYEAAADRIGVDNAVVTELKEDNAGLVDQCMVTFTFREDYEASADYEDDSKTGSSQASRYTMVNCSVSYWDLVEGMDTPGIDGTGAGAGSLSARTDYKNGEHDYATLETSTELTYTCEGSARWVESEHRFRASFTIEGRGTMHSVACDTREDPPCVTSDTEAYDQQSFHDIPLAGGYTITDIHYVDDPALGTVDWVRQITSADSFQPENPDPDGPCY